MNIKSKAVLARIADISTKALDLTIYPEMSPRWRPCICILLVPGKKNPINFWKSKKKINCDIFNLRIPLLKKKFE
jgi:hypothetical protein